ncbi:hypothetical protein HUJ05_011400 [Dendroctonus ponderosae]|nr:hypothetical protein HUJ05_011400 [Dendroctonus ponderosae]
MTNSENRTVSISKSFSVLVEETTREDIPLKTGTKQSKWYNCNEDCMGGSKFINVAFGVLTIIVTIALIVQIYYGDYQVVPHGSVATDSLECSRVGTQILKQGGKAVDAAIASAFCLAVVAPHLTGLDAEGQVLIYSHRTRISPDLVDFSGSNVISDRMPRLEPGQLLQHETLANTLEKIGNIPEKELYSYIDSSNHPVQSQAVSSSFYNYDVFVPSLDTIGPVLLVNLREIEEFNFTEVNTATTKRMIETTLRAYEEFNVTARFHEGTSTNIAVMDLDDDYVSFVTGMYDLFGSRELTIHGYVLDVKNKPKSCSRIPLILTDNKFICGKRLVFGANGVAQASQLVVNLIIGAKNATDGVEFPRFYLLDNATIAVEAAHSPKFQLELLEYLKAAHREPVLMPEPYYSSNAVEKLKDELSSHSDSRGGGIASRF